MRDPTEGKIIFELITASSLIKGFFFSFQELNQNKTEHVYKELNDDPGWLTEERAGRGQFQLKPFQGDGIH